MKKIIKYIINKYNIYILNISLVIKLFNFL